jgi:two-component system, chemotaxis family, chemotaxis protein CheY
MSRILVVDDDPDIRDLLSDAMELIGHCVNTAAHGGEALEQLARQRADLVLLDVMMPVMDGWTFLRHCRSDARWAALPVLVLSAMHDVHPAQAGAQAYMGKPFVLAALLEHVERLLTERTGSSNTGPAAAPAGVGSSLSDARGPASIAFRPAPRLG